MSSGGYSGPEPSSGTSRCGSLEFTTTVSSVDPDVLPSLEVGTVGQLIIQPEGELRRIVVVLADGAILGTIVEEWAQLIECMAAGYGFVATVLSVGPPVKVRVQGEGN